MEIVKTTFKELPANASGVVFLGCDLSTQENRDGFVNGLTDHLIDTGVLPKGTTPEQAWKNLYETTTTGGRTDLTYVCNDECKFNMGIFAAVRLGMGGELKWIEDFVNNQARDYGEMSRGPHAGLADLLFGETDGNFH